MSLFLSLSSPQILHLLPPLSPPFNGEKTLFSTTCLFFYRETTEWWMNGEDIQEKHTRFVAHGEVGGE